MLVRAGMGVSVSSRDPSADRSRHLARTLCTWPRESFQETCFWPCNGGRACLRMLDLGGPPFRGINCGRISKKRAGPGGPAQTWRGAPPKKKKGGGTHAAPPRTEERGRGE